MTKSGYIYLIAAVFSSTTVYSQYFPVSLIPDSLKNNAFLIIRDEVREVKMKSENSSVEKIVKILTVLNKTGEDMAYLSLLYDKNSSIKVNDIIYYDLNGKKIKSVKQSEITDSPAYGSSLLFSDNRIKHFKPNQSVYPYTIKYDYEINNSNIISFACWRPFNDYNISVQHSLFTIEYPLKDKINRKEINVQLRSSAKTSESVIDTWELNNLPAIEYEPFSISLQERIPSVYLMPAVLIYDQYKGTADNWANCGKWFYSLYQGKDEISDVEKLKIQSLVKDIPDTLERIRTLYRYMQGNTRYVAIALGLGGYQPFDAKTVFETGYGDCKALSNYMHSLLKYIGVKSFPARVSSGRYKEAIFTNFPNFQQFDHIILCVPHLHDTIWLECTNQRIPFGYLGAFTDDRKVLVTGESGGSLVRTKQYSQDENVQIRNGSVKLNPDGNGESGLKTSFKGILYENIFPILAMDENDRKLFIQKQISLPIFNLLSYSFSEDRSIVPCITENLKISLPNYGAIVGKRMYFNPNILSRFAKVPYRTQERKSEIYLRRSYQELDTIEYIIPLNYLVDKLPDKKNFKSKFGEYSSEVTSNGDKIKYVRLLKFTKGQYPVSDYNSFVDFCEQISVADQGKVILNSSK